MTEKGELIVFEGVGGCGKGTQLKLLAKVLTLRGKTVFTTCEHTRDSSIGRLIEDTIKKKNEGMDSDALQIAFVADRINHTKRVILPALNDYNFVLADRYEASTISYLREDLRRIIFDFQRNMGVRVPDLTLILDVDPYEAVKRVYGRGDQDIFDNVDKFKKVKEGYQWYSDNSGWPCVWIDGNGSKEVVSERVVNEIVKRKLYE